MNSPPRGVSDSSPSANLVVGVVTETLSKRLNDLAQTQQEATPEPKETGDVVDESFKWRCEELRNHFTPSEADKYRTRITECDYWELECNQYEIALDELMWQIARAAHGDGEPTADHWRTRARAYQGVLRRSGLSPARMREIRHSIDSQRYWQLESEVYRQGAVSQEAEMRRHLRKRESDRHSRMSTPRRASRLKRRQPVTSQPVAGENAPQPRGGIASRTRSQTKLSVAAGVTKRASRVRR